MRLLVPFLAMMLSGCVVPSFGGPGDAYCHSQYPDGSLVDCAADVTVTGTAVPDGWICLSTTAHNDAGWEFTYTKHWDGEDGYGLEWSAHENGDWQAVGAVVLRGDGVVSDLVIFDASQPGFVEVGTAPGRAAMDVFTSAYRLTEAPADATMDIHASHWDASPWYVLAVDGSVATVLDGMVAFEAGDESGWMPGSYGFQVDGEWFRSEAETLFRRSMVVQGLPTDIVPSADCGGPVPVLGGSQGRGDDPTQRHPQEAR